MEKSLEERLMELKTANNESKIIRNSFLDHSTLIETISLGYDFFLDYGDNKPSNKVIFLNEKIKFHLGYYKRDSLYYFSVMPLDKNDNFTEHKLNELKDNYSYEYSRFKHKRIFKKGKDEYRFVQDKDTNKMIMSYSSERKKVLYLFMVLANFYSNPEKIMQPK